MGQTNPYKATEELPPQKKAAHIQITQGPALESAYGNWAFVRWTSNNPGGKVLWVRFVGHHAEMLVASYRGFSCYAGNIPYCSWKDGL